MSGYLEHALLELERASEEVEHCEPADAQISEKHRLIMFGVAAITLDAARAEVGTIAVPIVSEREQAIALIYAIRCCSAHDISEPRWKLSPVYRRGYEVDGLQIDLSDRHGSVFEIAHVGGWNTLRHLAEYARREQLIGNRF